MVIELLGVPGAGKSTYVSEYFKENDAVDALNRYLYSRSRIKQNVNKVFLMVDFWIHNFQIAIKIQSKFDCIEFSSALTRFKMMLYVYSVIGAIDRANGTNRNNNNLDCVIDEGVNQVLWGIRYNSNDTFDKIMGLQTELVPYMGNKIIWLDVEKKIIKERLLERRINGGSELQRDILIDESKLDDSYRYIDEIIDGLNNLQLSDRIIRI